jgi:hypothetical protein
MDARRRDLCIVVFLIFFHLSSVQFIAPNRLLIIVSH